MLGSNRHFQSESPNYIGQLGIVCFTQRYNGIRIGNAMSHDTFAPHPEKWCSYETVFVKNNFIIVKLTVLMTYLIIMLAYN